MAKKAVNYKNLGLKDGEKCLVSWKGVKDGVFHNQKNGVCFVTFDNGDGTGTRLHRVLTSTVKPMPKAEPAPKAKTPAKAKAPAKAKTPAPKAEAPKTQPLTTKGMSAQEIIALAQALDTLSKLGYEVQELIA